MTTPFALRGAAPRLPVATVDPGISYDAASQRMVMIDEDGVTVPVVSAAGAVIEMARTRVQTWSRDPKRYDYKIKDDTTEVND